MKWVLDPEEAETDAIHRLVNFGGRDVVEIGAGDGRLTWRYADRAASVLALDVGASHVGRAQEETPEHLRTKVVFQQSDITVDELPEDAFDIALLSWSIC